MTFKTQILDWNKGHFSGDCILEMCGKVVKCERCAMMNTGL